MYENKTIWKATSVPMKIVRYETIIGAGKTYTIHLIVHRDS